MTKLLSQRAGAYAVYNYDKRKLFINLTAEEAMKHGFATLNDAVDELSDYLVLATPELSFEEADALPTLTDYMYAFRLAFCAEISDQIEQGTADTYRWMDVTLPRFQCVEKIEAAGGEFHTLWLVYNQVWGDLSITHLGPKFEILSNAVPSTGSQLSALVFHMRLFRGRSQALMDFEAKLSTGS